MRSQTDNKTSVRRPKEGQRLLTGYCVVLYAALAAGALTRGPSVAQQITGTPGAPNATQTIDGRYLPNQSPIGRRASYRPRARRISC